MKPTLLELHQSILSAMDSDEINSISDTPESRQVTEVLKTSYFNLVALGEFPRDNNVWQLEASTNPLFPVTMTLPSDVNDIRWIKYDAHTSTDTAVRYQEVYPMPFWDFIQLVTNMNPTDSNVMTYTHTVGTNTWTLYAKNDAVPRYYTTADDHTILFDSYDSAVDSTLQRSKTMVFGQKNYDWLESDTFILPLDDKQFQRLLNEAKALAFAELKQSQHLKAEKTARDLKIDQQSSKTKAPLQTDYDKVSIRGRPTVYGNTKPTGRYK